VAVDGGKVIAQPAAAQVVHHAQGGDDLGVAHAVVGEARGPPGGHGAFVQFPLAQPLGGHADQDDGNDAQQARNAQGRMEQEQDQQKKRGEGQIEERDQRVSGEKGADLVHLCQRRPAHTLVQVGAKQGVEDRIADHLVEPDRHPHHQSGAVGLQEAEADDQTRGDRRQRDQGVHVPAGEHPVEQVHHVQRLRQDQEIDQEAEQPHDEQGLAHESKRLAGHGFRLVFSPPQLGNCHV